MNLAITGNTIADPASSATGAWSAKPDRSPAAAPRAPHISLANLTRHGTDQLVVLVKTRLKPLQYRPGLIDGFRAKPWLRAHTPVTSTIEDL
jgi:hypothetical protein